jgi:hypothetical protein
LIAREAREDQGHVRVRHREPGVGAGKLLVPATLGLLAPADPSKPFTIRVIARKAGKPRMLREVVTTIPRDRTAMLRLPIQWLCDDSARTTQAGDVESTCPAGQTCTAAGCVDATVDMVSLPGFDPAEVYGGGTQAADGTCFDTVACMKGATSATPDAQCTVGMPAGGLGVNVALRPSGSDGICDSSNSECYVPLDADDQVGWSAEGNRIRLPRRVCEQIASGRIKSVVVSTGCETKRARNPTCGPWFCPDEDQGCPALAGSLSGSWSGACGSYSVKGSFNMTVSGACAVSGTYTGTQSGTLSGKVGSTGSLTAASGSVSGGSITWGGTVTASEGKLTGSGTWSGNDPLAGACSGTWSGTGSAGGPEPQPEGGLDAGADAPSDAKVDASSDGKIDLGP